MRVLPSPSFDAGAPQAECPRHYCFFWEPAGTRSAPGLHRNLDDALALALNAPPSLEDACGCSFGVCSRLSSDGDRDWYEPHEPNLDRAGLSHDHFIPVERREPRGDA